MGEHPRFCLAKPFSSAIADKIDKSLVMAGKVLLDCTLLQELKTLRTLGKLCLLTQC